MRAHLRKFASLRADLRQLVGTCDSMPQQEAGYVQQGTTVSFSWDFRHFWQRKGDGIPQTRCPPAAVGYKIRRMYHTLYGSRPWFNSTQLLDKSFDVRHARSSMLLWVKQPCEWGARQTPINNWFNCIRLRTGLLLYVLRRQLLYC